MVVITQNWLKWGFGHDLDSQSKTKPFVIDYSAAQSSPLPTRDILDQVCWDIAETHPGPITLMISGGVDSQAMSYAFKQAGVPVRYAMVRYNGGLNDHDLFDTSFYPDNGIKPDVIDMDIIAFHEEDLIGWALEYQNHSPHILSQCRIASLLDGTIVSSGSIVTRQGIGTMNYSVYGLQRYAEISSRPMVPYFFNHDSAFVARSRDFVSTSENMYLAKVAAYHEAGLPVQPQTQKQHGFERLKALYDDRRIDVRTRLRYSKYPSQRPYDLLFRYPLMDLVPYSDQGHMRF